MRNLLALLLCLSGCSLAPEIKRPELDLPDQFQNRPASQPLPISVWWHSFEDPILVTLVETAAANNHNLRIAAERVAEARAFFEVERGKRLPEVGFTAEARRFRSSENGSDAGSGAVQLGLADAYGSELRAGFQASWELDLFGRLRGMRAAAYQDFRASEEARETVSLLVASETARLYFERLGVVRRLNLAVQRAASREQTLQLVREKFAAGLSSRLDVVRAEGQWQAAQTRIALLDGERNQIHQALCLVVGEYPEDLMAVLERSGQPRLPSNFANGSPRELLDRRPDIRQAWANVLAGYRRVGVAKTDLLPRIQWRASLATAASDGRGLWRAGSLTGLLGPTLSLPIFSRGRIRARIRSVEARYRISLVAYERKILEAITDVESASGAFASATRALSHARAAVVAAEEAHDLAQTLYEQGLTDLLTVLDSERRLTEADEQRIQVETQSYASAVLLYKALGG